MLKEHDGDEGRVRILAGDHSGKEQGRIVWGAGIV